MSYEVLDVRPMTKRIGAEIFGIDLAKPLGNREVSELHDALMEHQVIFFRDQHLDHDSHKRLGRCFGDLAYHSGVAGLPRKGQERTGNRGLAGRGVQVPSRVAEDRVEVCAGREPPRWGHLHRRR